MAEIIIQMKGYRCERCEHEWVPHQSNSKPRTCPHCKSAYWDTPRKNKTPQSAKRKQPAKAAKTG
jgi:predicted Zn-ribbon and HTH transcriptional regulator